MISIAPKLLIATLAILFSFIGGCASHEMSQANPIIGPDGNTYFSIGSVMKDPFGNTLSHEEMRMIPAQSQQNTQPQQVVVTQAYPVLGGKQLAAPSVQRTFSVAPQEPNVAPPAQGAAPTAIAPRGSESLGGATYGSVGVGTQWGNAALGAVGTSTSGWLIRPSRTNVNGGNSNSSASSSSSSAATGSATATNH